MEAPQTLYLPTTGLYLFPSEASHCFVIQKEKEKLICLMCISPPTTKTIRFRDIECQANIPQLLWVHSLSDYVHFFSSQIKVFEFQAKDNQLWKRAYRIGNTINDGRICWGTGHMPSNLRYAYLQFFTSIFSDAYLPRHAIHNCKNSKEIAPYNENYPWEGQRNFISCKNPTCICCLKKDDCYTCYRNQNYMEYVKDYDGSKLYDSWQDALIDFSGSQIASSQEFTALQIQRQKNTTFNFTWLKKVDGGWSGSQENSLLIKEIEITQML